ncbi:50S ribosomal protein YmL27, variant [Blastomyces gilchristii SLH14081]|uniref:50S ribosomal protein YmL27 n=3 Tax=Blastomyces TaxID=229219 RepID=A0A179UL06_BLAGS|nr:MRP-L27 domain-containing protein [Blastomyces gilchristii SLH14081]XP_031577583.1 50S ribosomal protein YmL27, variant [Blastomyces gilchristii SLH14081]OAT07081.1 50S ribosomal protein YmL27 [Blastomyces gilchristii SLH14081]OAT07082.1 50S ribosomal protein YmL27, variant [Blastomyces gilchristii SLH14081]
MFKPTRSLNARLRLTTKQVGGGYYKGNRTGNVGYFGRKKGTYFIDWRKVRTYVVPEGLDTFKLTPFVTKRMEPTRTHYTQTIMIGDREVEVPRGMNGKDYLDDWYANNELESDEMERIRREEVSGQEDTAMSDGQHAEQTTSEQKTNPGTHMDNSKHHPPSKQDP